MPSVEGRALDTRSKPRVKKSKGEKDRKISILRVGASDQLALAIPPALEIHGWQIAPRNHLFNLFFFVPSSLAAMESRNTAADYDIPERKIEFSFWNQFKALFLKSWRNQV